MSSSPSKPTAYSITQIALHWTIAVLVFFQILVHDGIEQAWRARVDGTVPDVATPNLHVIVGLLILALVGWRLWLRFTRGVPALPEREHPYLRAIAAATHGTFYVLLLVLPLTGALAWFGSVRLAATSHALIEKLLLLVIAAHILGALVQHLWFRSNVLMRMLGRP